MIKINNEIKKVQKNFWNNCLFHPTDAIEDPWGKRILDRFSKDKSIQTVRIWAMLEDIVYIDENGEMAYDFRMTDLRIDYLLEKGFNILIAYGMIPECIASNKTSLSNVAKKKTRYKGKMINTSEPKDYKLWEEVCYNYTKHLVDRYGEAEVSKWYLQCLNEPDILSFFIPEYTNEQYVERVEKYSKLYTSFVNGILKVSDKLHFGGPVLSSVEGFLECFLNFIRESGTRLDFIAVHNYARTFHVPLNNGTKRFDVRNWIEKQTVYQEIIDRCGFSDTEVVVDEWGMSSMGFFNIEECPAFVARDTEVYSSYYVKLIHQIIENNFKFSKMLICLSGQHEMTTEFSGFRNFFSMSFAPKPLYNAYVLASKLYEGLTEAEHNTENLYVIPTKNDQNDYSVLMTYSKHEFEEDLPEITKELTFEDDIKDKTVTIYCIDKNTSNAYRLYEKMGKPEPISDEQIQILKDEGKVKPIKILSGAEQIKLNLTANSVYLVEVK